MDETQNPVVAPEEQMDGVPTPPPAPEATPEAAPEVVPAEVA